MRKIFFLLMFVILISFTAKKSNAQYWELGLKAGPTFYHGDLTHGWVEFKEMNFMGGAFLRYAPNEFIAIRGGLYYGRISGSDEHATDPTLRIRNLHFRSEIMDVSAFFEFHPFGYNPNHTRGNSVAPYIFAGISVFSFNPKTEINDNWVPLQPLGTEGQGLIEYPGRQQYALTQFAIPMGFGVKFKLSNVVTLALEVAPRKTFTDYLDDVSTTHVDTEILRARRGELAARLSERSAELDIIDSPHFSDGMKRGNPEDNDWYTFSGITISFNLSRQSCFFR